MHILDAPRLKLAWAEKHLNALDSLIAAFVKSNPMIITRNDYLDQGLQGFRMEFSSTRIPFDASILAGYAVHDMRSSLDWLVYGLTEYHGKTSDLSKTEFPIFWKRPTGRAKKNFDDKIEGLPDEVKRVIELLQPYYTEDRSGSRFPAKSQRLWQLHQLDITDKHRGLIARANMGGISLPTGIQRSIKRFDDGAVEFVIPTQDDNFDPKPSIDIVFRAEDVPDPVSVDRLWQIHGLIGQGIFPMLTAHIPMPK